MDSPKAPDDARDWNSIDIYLFTNGQEYSPPRKYHLKTEQIKWWDATLNLLARSQLGSLQTNIELYTLDGNKINTPLELRNDTAYVAVSPPETFVQTGYEKYLLKASRSWEKRHERPNNTETIQSERGNTIISTEQIKSNLDITDNGNVNDGKNKDDVPIDTKIKYLANVQNNEYAQPQKVVKRLQHSKTTDNSIKTAKPERKPESYAKNTILKKFYSNSKSIDDSHNSNKKRTASFPKNLIKPSNNKKSPTHNTGELKMNLEEAKSIDLPNETHMNTVKTIETKEKTEMLKNDPAINILPDLCNKDISDVYKNAESDIQSLFIEADRKTSLLSNEKRNIPCVLENTDECISKPAENCLKVNMANSQQSTNNVSEIQTPYHTPYNVNPGTFNINLNIDLKGYTVHKPEDESQSNKCKTYVSLMKPEKASQINIDVNLSKENLNLGHDALLREQSAESGVQKTCEEKYPDNKTKVIVHCKCNFNKPDTSTRCNFNENDRYLIVIPAERNDKFMQRNDLETRRGSDKAIQELLQSCIRVPLSTNSEIVSKKPEHVMKHKVSISQEAPKEINLNNVQGDVIQNTYLNDNATKPKSKIDNFAQTDWCNTLLQVKYHEDGNYSFHLPPLDLLSQYNLL